MVILTGGAGFIGSCLLKKLNDNDITDVMVVDRLGTGEKWKNLVGKRFNSFVHADQFRLELELIEPDEIDAIIHLGACTSTMEKNADYLIDNNFNYTKDLAIFAAANEIRFIYASSAATYGDGSKGYSDDHYTLRPLNMYGLSKHLFDLWVLENAYYESFTGLKFFNVFGPNEYHKGDMASMIYKAYEQIRTSGKVKLFKSNSPEYPDGGQMRDFIYVKDVVEVIWNILQDETFSGIYNLGTGQPHSWNQLMEQVFKAMNREPNIEYIDMPDSLSSQYQNYTCANMAKLGRTGCNIEFSSLENSVGDYVNNYLLQEWKHF